jgi:hypothetical protein
MDNVETWGERLLMLGTLSVPPESSTFLQIQLTSLLPFVPGRPG